MPQPITSLSPKSRTSRKSLEEALNTTTIAEAPCDTTASPVLVEETVIVLPSTATVVNPNSKINMGFFWGWAVFSFMLPFIIVAAVLGGVNPPIAQGVDSLGQPNGQRDWAKIFGAAAVAGLIILIIYVLVVLGRPERFYKKE